MGAWSHVGQQPADVTVIFGHTNAHGASDRDLDGWLSTSLCVQLHHRSNRKSNVLTLVTRNVSQMFFRLHVGGTWPCLDTKQKIHPGQTRPSGTYRS